MARANTRTTAAASRCIITQRKGGREIKKGVLNMGIVFRDARMQGIKKRMSSMEKRNVEQPRRDEADESEVEEQEKCSKNIIF